MELERKSVVVVGSINIDLVANAERIPVCGETVSGSNFQSHPGGKGANQAVAVARLGYPVRMIGRLGDDAFGEQMRAHLTGAGVDIGGVACTPGSSGIAVIVVAESGENSIVIVPGANAAVSCEDIDRNIESIRAAGVVLTQLEIPMETVLHLATVCEREGVPLILDPAPAREFPAGLLAKVEWVTPNETEAAILMKSPVQDAEECNPVQAAAQLLASGARGVVLKRGARGAYLRSHGGEAGMIAPFAVKAVDSTAAGDCFNGAFATGLMMGMDAMESARFASAAAAISVTRAGAQPSMPSMDDVKHLMDAGSV